MFWQFFELWSESDEPDIDLENQYYSAKSLKGDDDDGALAGFKRVLELESQGEERGQWGFKALKQMTKINFYLGRFDAMLDAYRKNCQLFLSCQQKNCHHKLSTRNCQQNLRQVRGKNTCLAWWIIQPT